MTQQRTLARPAYLSGVGLHSGEEVSVELTPAQPDTAVVFVRVDLPGSPRVEARAENLVERPRRTALASGAAEVQTTEHLLAALWACGIDNVEVRLNKPELPGMDGSALPFCEALRQAGTIEQPRRVRELRLREPLAVHENGASVVASPADGGLRVSYSLDYRSTGLASARQLGVQHLDLRLDEETFLREVAPARTFVLEEEVEALRREGLGKGANTRNTVVVGADGVVDNELRFPDECVRHKVLDLVGDLYLLGRRLRASVEALRSGHRLNVKLAQRILASTAREREVEDILAAGRDGLDSRQIERLLPHRFPFLLLDRVVTIEENRAVGLKNLTYNESFFKGHFPGRPVLPGVLQVEAMAQLAGILLLRDPANARRLAFLLSLDRVKFRRTVTPGDQLVLEAELEKQKGNTAQVQARALVDGAVACEAQMRYMLVDS